MIRKILRITAKVLAGMFLFYLLLAGVLLPFGISWGLRHQGTKILRHPVRVQSVRFNPFLWRLDIRALEILEQDGQGMAGFAHLGVDVSFLRLLKKEIRVESLLLEGLNIHAVLRADGGINLLDLVPPPASAKEEQSAASQAEAASQSPEAAPADLPLVVDDLRLTEGRVRFTDRSVQPSFTSVLDGIDVHVTGISTRPDAVVKAVVAAHLDGRGKIAVETSIQPFVQPLALESMFTLDNYALQAVTPYVGKYTGREVKTGSLTLRLDYRIGDNQLNARHKLLVQSFDFGKKVESPDALNLPFGLAVALLEDPQGKIDISLPVKGDLSDPEFEFWPVVGQVARNFFVKLVTKPFSILASLVSSESGDEEMGYVRFVPGEAGLSDAEKDKLAALTQGLKARPKLRLEINGGYDPEADWKAVKTSVLDRDYQALQQESTRTESWVYQQLFQRRFGVRALWALTNTYQRKDGSHDDVKMIAELRRRLIEDAPPDKVALAALAMARAKAIYDVILASGFDASRMTIGSVRPVQVSMGQVPLEMTLTVFDQAAPPAPSGEEPLDGSSAGKDL